MYKHEYIYNYINIPCYLYVETLNGFRFNVWIKARLKMCAANAIFYK